MLNVLAGCLQIGCGWLLSAVFGCLLLQFVADYTNSSLVLVKSL
jgi:hypothetical protein